MLYPTENSQAFVEMYKIAVIGGPHSGKTSLLKRVIGVYSVCEDPWRASIQERIGMRYNLVKEIKKRQGLDSTEFPILILGTKKDHVAERVIDIGKMEAIAAELRCLFGECSAKFNMDGKVEELIIGLLRIVKA